MAEVLVLVDQVDGEVKKVTFELLTAARRLGEPSAVVVGAPGTATQSVFGGEYTVKSTVAKGVPVISVHGGAIEPEAAEGAAAVEAVALPEIDAAKATRIASREPIVGGDRPDLAEASVVVSGG